MHKISSGSWETAWASISLSRTNTVSTITTIISSTRIRTSTPYISIYLTHILIHSQLTFTSRWNTLHRWALCRWICMTLHILNIVLWCPCRARTIFCVIPVTLHRPFRCCGSHVSTHDTMSKYHLPCMPFTAHALHALRPYISIGPSSSCSICHHNLAIVCPLLYGSIYSHMIGKRPIVEWTGYGSIKTANRTFSCSSPMQSISAQMFSALIDHQCPGYSVPY